MVSREGVLLAWPVLARSWIDTYRDNPRLKFRAVDVLNGNSEEQRHHWTKSYPDWRQERDRIKAGGDALKAMPLGLSGDVPAFLQWREQHCAYIDGSTGRAVMAKNNWYQKDAYANFEEHNRLIMVLPPGHIKTTLFAIEHSTWAIQNNRNVRILNIQKNEEEAAKVIAAVQDRLTDHEYYQHLQDRLVAQGDGLLINPIAAYGGRNGYKALERTGARWGAHAFKVSGRTAGEKDDTMQAKGAGSQIQGIRSDIIILDDIQDPSRISPIDTDKLAQWFQRVILGRLLGHQKLVILGNLFHPSDFMNWLIETYGDMWPVVRYPAILESGEPLCPELWSIEGLEAKKKEVGETTWFYTWMQAEGDVEDATFRREAMEEAKDPDFIMGETPAQVTHTFIGVDPALSQFCAIVCWGLDIRTGQRYLIDIFNQKGMRNWEEVMAVILRFTSKYSASAVAIEWNNTQQHIHNSEWFKREIRALGAKILPYQTRTSTGARAEADDFDISSVGALFDSGLVTMPYGDNASREAVDDYVSQCLIWRPKPPTTRSWHLTRDMVMATLFAEYPAREMYLRFKNKPTLPPRKPKHGWTRTRTKRWKAPERPALLLPT